MYYSNYYVIFFFGSKFIMLSDLYRHSISFQLEIFLKNKTLSIIIKKKGKRTTKRCGVVSGVASLLIKSFKFEFWIALSRLYSLHDVNLDYSNSNVM